MPEAAQDQLLARQRNWITKMRGTLWVASAFAATAAFLANLFWRGDTAGRAACQPVMLGFCAFRVFNTMAFETSVLLGVLVSSERFYRTGDRMAALMLITLFDVGCLVSAFVLGTSPEDPLGAFVYLVLAPVAVCGLNLAAVVYIIRRWMA